ncbi:MAG: phage holin [Clostridia bacterium]|nr:phage holin [Clostridia bacterium]MBQ9460978.1 phage holin [Clostridia bacterium]
MNTNVSTGTIARTAALAVTLLNMILTAAGKNPLPFSDTDAYSAVSTAATAVTAVIAWWKNNSFTENAKKADKYMQELNNEESDF